VARYVLIEFDNDAEADSFVVTINGTDSPFIGTATMRAIGVYQKPTMFCECPGVDDTSVRGAKHGWWLHRKCGKPKRGHVQHPLNKLTPDVKPKDQMRRMYIGVNEPLSSLPSMPVPADQPPQTAPNNG